MVNSTSEWTQGKAFLVIFGGVLLALVAHDVLNGIIEGIKAALAH